MEGMLSFIEMMSLVERLSFAERLSFVELLSFLEKLSSTVSLCLVRIAGLMKGSFVCKDMNPVSCFVLQDHVVTAALEKPLKCSLHGDIKIMHMAPDLVRERKGGRGRRRGKGERREGRRRER